jgi:hypothetical protein
MSAQRWCVASYCSTPVLPGTILCRRHEALITDRTRGELARLHPDAPLLLFEAPTQLVEALEAIAEAIETVAIAERASVVNRYRMRAGVVRAVLERAEAPKQARLLEEHPDLNGAYGPSGRRQ